MKKIESAALGLSRKRRSRGERNHRSRTPGRVTSIVWSSFAMDSSDQKRQRSNNSLNPHGLFLAEPVDGIYRPEEFQPQATPAEQSDELNFCAPERCLGH